MLKAVTTTFVSVICLCACLTQCAAGVDVITGLTDEAVLQPGARKDGRIVLRNAADVPQEARVYQTDYTFRCDGTSAYDKPGSCPRSNASWITFSPQQFTIPAKEVLVVYYAIQVPKDDKLSGTYWSMLMVEPIAAVVPEAAPSEDGKVTVGVRTILRYGIQMVVHIGNTGRREIKVLDKRLAETDGKRALQLDIENTGERWVRPTTWAEIYDEKGLHAGKFKCNRTRIFPGCSTRNSIDLTGLKAGKYQALVVIDNGDESVWGAQYALEIR